MLRVECAECDREILPKGGYYVVNYPGTTVRVCSLPCVLTSLSRLLQGLVPDGKQTPILMKVQMLLGE
jgi:hypothetical protein